MACGLEYIKKESIAFSVKTACTLFIVVGVLRGPRWGAVTVRRSLADVNSTWRPGSAADWQTVPLQSAANQPVSSARCYRGHNVQPAAPPVTPRGFASRPSQRPPSWTPSSVNMPSKASGGYLRQDLEQAQLHSGCKGGLSYRVARWGGGGWGGGWWVVAVGER